jgi:outer membrane immunogenic protein
MGCGTVRYKLLSLLAVGFSLGASPLVRAADLPLKAPLMAPPSAYNWAGWYVGGNIGYGWGDSSAPNVSFVDPGAIVGFAPYFAAGGNVIPHLHPDGVVGGGQIGFNWQMSPNWVAGLVTDFQGSGMKAAASNAVAPPGGLPLSVQSNSENIDWFGTVRAKFGYAQNNWLLYATGGLAYGQVATAGSFVGPGSPLAFAGSTSTTKAGWAAGAGLNYGLTRNWIVGVEYLYVDLGRVSYTETQPAVAPAASLSVSNRAATQVARVSLDYKF